MINILKVMRKEILMSSPFDSRIGTSTGDASSGPSTGKALRHIRGVDFHQGHNREKDERLGTNTGDALSGPSTDGKTLKHKGRILPGYGKEPTVDTEEVRREKEIGRAHV